MRFTTLPVKFQPAIYSLFAADKGTNPNTADSKNTIKKYRCTACSLRFVQLKIFFFLTFGTRQPKLGFTLAFVLEV